MKELMEKAKRILMVHHEINEKEAIRRLQKERMAQLRFLKKKWKLGILG